MIAKPDDINPLLCEALGLDPSKVKSLTIILSPQEPVLVEAELFVTDVDGAKLGAVLSRYKLVRGP